MKFVCPVCNEPFSSTENGSLRCRNNHSFDRSKEGYYNLLLSSSGGVHGDNKEMLSARRRFLESGAYEPLARAVFEELSSRLPSSSELLDMGCGEGYYTDYVSKAASVFGKPFSLHAFDISKDAVKLAAKRNKSISFIVASSYHVPALSESFDGVFNVFSPLAIEETSRVLKPGGIFVMAIPDENHLFGLKAAIYDKPYKNEPQESEIPGFELLSTRRLAYPLKLDSREKINDLFMMTPYAYRTGARERERISRLDTLECNAEFIVFTYRKDF